MDFTVFNENFSIKFKEILICKTSFIMSAFGPRVTEVKIYSFALAVSEIVGKLLCIDIYKWYRTTKHVVWQFSIPFLYRLPTWFA